MLRALLADLLEIPGLELSITRDARVSPLQMPVAVNVIGPDVDVWQSWRQAMETADAIWLIAPETGGVLERLSCMAVATGKTLLGSLPGAVAIAARKSITSQVLSRHGITVLPTWLPQHFSFGQTGEWVAKPDDGAGCEDTCRFANPDRMRAWLRVGNRMESHVIQPYLDGVPASLSMLCRDGMAWLLSCNRQRIRMDRGTFSYHGSVLNEMTAYWTDFERIGQKIAQAVPGLAGYVGVDVMVSDDTVTVLEINPRLTTSYAGMRMATGLNPARLVLDMFYNENFQWPQSLARNIVEFSLDE